MPEPALLEELLAGNPTSRLLGVAKDRAIANGGFDAVPQANQDAKAIAEMLELAVSAARLVSKSGAKAMLTPAQEGALELFVLLVSRPALFVARGRVTELPENWPELGRDQTLTPATIAAVGRVEGANRDKLGTAFLAGERRILTNNHVLCALFGRALDFWEKDPNT
jgi:hypothetical protein